MPSFAPMSDAESDSDALAFPTFAEAAPTSKPSKQPDIAVELLEVFRMEAEDHLRVLTKTLPRAKKEAVAKDDWLEVRRAAHTLKGAAAMVGFCRSYHAGPRHGRPARPVL